jgi:hypothetical protein
VLLRGQRALAQDAQRLTPATNKHVFSTPSVRSNERDTVTTQPYSLACQK